MSLKAFLRSIKVRPIKFHALGPALLLKYLRIEFPTLVVMKIGDWKKSATMDIYLRLAGVDTKGATDCLHFVPEDISFEDNAADLFSDS